MAAAYDRLYYQYMIDKRPDDAERILKLKVENNPKSSNYLLQLAAHYVIVNRRPDMDAVIRTLTDEKQFPDGHLMAGDFYFSGCANSSWRNSNTKPGSPRFRRTKRCIRSAWSSCTRPTETMRRRISWWMFF